MATTIVPAKLKMTIEEKVTLNGRERGSKNELIKSAITQLHERILSIPATATTAQPIDVANFSDAATGAGTFVDGKVSYARITNLDSSASIVLRFIAQSAANSAYSVVLPAGKTHLISSMRMEVVTDGSAWAGTDELAKIECFYETTPTSAVDLEIIIAQTAN